MNYLGIDIGGTWIKGALVGEDYFNKSEGVTTGSFEIKKIASPLHENARPVELVAALKELIASFSLAEDGIAGIGISTGGIVNYHGTKVLNAASHLNVLKGTAWKEELERQLQCSTVIINDADAAAIGLAEKDSLTGNKTIGIMPVGTGLGFSVWRNGRRWQPGKGLTLLGSIRTPERNYDSIASASRLASLDENNNLINVLTLPSFKREREDYLQNLVKIINSAAILYSLDEVFICGGLADASNSCKFLLEKELNNLLAEIPAERDKPVEAFVSKEGNHLQLIGALALARGESIAVGDKVVLKYNTIDTEIPYNNQLQLQELETQSVVETLWQAEQEAGELMRSSLTAISDIAEKAIERVQSGGRLIYVGCGTSGRIAAMDAVEIPCTYGFPEERILAVVAGGISDASIEIESDFEEDASAVPEMLLLNLQANDTIVGISASGTAYYVQSALSIAKSRGALTVLVKTQPATTGFSFCDYILPLNSGHEVVAGSTRMKAGTATKKVLNFLSSTIMIKTGKVAGPYMVDMACINNKLVERAQDIMKILFNIEKEEALKLLEESGMSLSQAIKKINAKNMDTVKISNQ